MLRGDPYLIQDWIAARARSGRRIQSLRLLAPGHIKSGRAHRAAIWRHLASMRFVMAFTLASSAAQKARLAAAVRILGGPRLVTRGGLAVMGGSKTKGTETVSARGEPTDARYARARPQ